MPDAVDRPAPVRTTTRRARRQRVASSSGVVTGQEGHATAGGATGVAGSGSDVLTAIHAPARQPNGYHGHHTAPASPCDHARASRGYRRISGGQAGIQAGPTAATFVICGRRSDACQMRRLTLAEPGAL